MSFIAISRPLSRYRIAEAFLSQRLFRRTNSRWFPREIFGTGFDFESEMGSRVCTTSAIEIFKGSKFVRILFLFFFNSFKTSNIFTVLLGSTIVNWPINLPVYRFRSLFIIVSHPLYATIHISWRSVKIEKKKKKEKIIISKEKNYIPPPFRIFETELSLFRVYLIDRLNFPLPLARRYTNYETLTWSFIDRWTFCCIFCCSVFFFVQILMIIYWKLIIQL